MKITIYELLGRIKDDNLPEKIKYNKNGFEEFYKGVLYERLMDEDNFLNDIVEILEEPKGIPEKLEILPNNEQYSNKVLYGKINEIIDYLEYLESKEE